MNQKNSSISLSALYKALFISRMGSNNVGYDCVAWSSGIHTTKAKAYHLVKQK